MTEPRIDRAERRIAASPETVYRALIDPDAWVRWLPPNGMTGRIEAFDPRPGGGYRMELSYDDPTGARGKTTSDSDVVEGRFWRLDPDREVVHLVTFESDDEACDGEMRMAWRVEPDGEGSLVEFAAEDVPPGIDPEDHVVGLTASLAQLAAEVEQSDA